MFCILALMFLAVFVFIALTNGGICLLQVVRWLRGISPHEPGVRSLTWVPLVGGISGMAGVLLCPAYFNMIPWWLPLLVDYGSIPGLTIAGFYFLIVRR